MQLLTASQSYLLGSNFFISRLSLKMKSSRYIWIFISFGLSDGWNPGTPAVWRVVCWSRTFWSKWVIIFRSVSFILVSCLIFITRSMCSSSSGSQIFVDQSCISTERWRRNVLVREQLIAVTRNYSHARSSLDPSIAASASQSRAGSPIAPWQFQISYRSPGNWPTQSVVRKKCAFGISWNEGD